MSTIPLPPPLAQMLSSRRFERIVVFSGAGMSADSGIPTFRSGSNGLWGKFGPQQLATPKAWQRCAACAERHALEDPPQADHRRHQPPQCCRRGGDVRPGVVWFGEDLDQSVVRQASRRIAACDLLLIIGTSGVVYPAAGMVRLAPQSAVIVEINPDPWEDAGAGITGGDHGRAGAARGRALLAGLKGKESGSDVLRIDPARIDADHRLR